MRPGIRLLKSALLLCAVLAASRAEAHRLEADYRVLPGRKVQVESWFDITGDPARGARVQVLRPGGQALAEGLTDDNGIFVFSFHDPETLQVSVYAGMGHRAEVVIPEAELKHAGGNVAGADEGAAAGSATAPGPRVERTSTTTLKDVVTGVGILLGLAAFVLSVRNARQLRQLRRQPPTQETRYRAAP
jgi:hypothetical protein